MHPLFAIIESGIRGLLSAALILSMLAMNMGADLHVALPWAHDHPTDGSCHELLAHGHADADDDLDDSSIGSENCGHCHCPTLGGALPCSAPSIVGAISVVVARLPSDALRLQGISFQPDPPPIRG